MQMVNGMTIFLGIEDSISLVGWLLLLAIEET